MTLFRADNLTRFRWVRGVATDKWCKTCLSTQNPDGRSWRRSRRQIPKARQLIQQTTVNGVFHVVDTATGERTCKVDR